MRSVGEVLVVPSCPRAQTVYQNDRAVFTERDRRYVLGAGEEEMNRAVAHVPSGEGEKSLRVFGEMVTYKVSSDQTGGAYSLFEVETPPGGGPPPHVQHREDESFYVLRGEFEFVVEGRTISAGVGSLIYVPKGNLHAHKNVGKGVGSMLVSQTPGGLCEHFFEAVGKPMNGDGTPLVCEDQPDTASVVKVAAEYGIEIPVPIT
jgi:mannose-6-phosphate isomerase-like protein (cupin superfamily)